MSGATPYRGNAAQSGASFSTGWLVEWKGVLCAPLALGSLGLASARLLAGDLDTEGMLGSGFGVIFGLFMTWVVAVSFGRYQFAIDAARDAMVITRSGGIGPRGPGHVPLSEIAEVEVCVTQRASAWTDYQVVLRMRRDDDFLAVPIRMGHDAAYALAGRIRDALDPASDATRT